MYSSVPAEWHLEWTQSRDCGHNYYLHVVLLRIQSHPVTTSIITVIQCKGCQPKAQENLALKTVSLFSVFSSLRQGNMSLRNKYVSRCRRAIKE